MEDLVKFDESGRVADPEIRKAADVQMELVCAYLPTEPDLKVGVGLLLWHDPKWRLTAQVVDSGVGLGVARRLVPVIDISVGAGAYYLISAGRVVPSVFVSMYRW